MPQPTRDNRSLERHTGADATLKWSVDDAAIGDQGTYWEVPVTNVSWTRDHTTEQVQHNGSLKPTLATSELRYTGSFEYSGQNPGLLNRIMHNAKSSAYGTGGAGNIENIEDGRPIRGTLTVKEYNHDEPNKVEATITFRRVLVSGHDRDVSTGSVSTSSFDWEAEDMVYTPSSTSD